jgi:hypothetical protein
MRNTWDNVVDLPFYALRRYGRRWSVLAASDDPRGPAWRVVDAFDEPGESEVAVWVAEELRRIRESRTMLPSGGG